MMATTKFIDRFGMVGTKYAAFRPSYPPQLYEIIQDHIKDTDKELAFDIGCGNGQATVELAKFIKKVIGFEPSAGQLESAKKADNVEYRQSPAESIKWDKDHSVDLITVAQAAHWFDLPVFFKETDRLLKPNGSLILWSYGICSYDNKDAESIHLDFYDNLLGDQYWAPNRRLIDRKYVDIVPPYKNTIRKDIIFNKKTTIAGMIGYYGTWSGYNKFLETNQCVLPSIRERLMKAYNTTDDTLEIEISFPVYMILSKKD